MTSPPPDETELSSFLTSPEWVRSQSPTPRGKESDAESLLYNLPPLEGTPASGSQNRGSVREECSGKPLVYDIASAWQKFAPQIVDSLPRESGVKHGSIERKESGVEPSMYTIAAA